MNRAPTDEEMQAKFFEGEISYREFLAYRKAQEQQQQFWASDTPRELTPEEHEAFLKTFNDAGY